MNTIQGRSLFHGMFICMAFASYVSASAATVDFTKLKASGSSFTSDVVITNDSTADISSWQLSLRLGNSITAVDKVTISGSDPCVIKNGPKNGSIKAGRDEKFSLTASGTFNPNALGVCTFNSSPCTFLIDGKPISSSSSSLSSSSTSNSSSTSSSSSSGATGKTYGVSTAADLIKALALVNPGDTIQLSPGSYNGVFIATRSGARGNPITLSGPATAILSNKNYGFSLKANYWKLTGFTVAYADKGIVLDGANHNLLDKLTVHSVLYEGVHFRSFSSDNVIQYSNIYNTGSNKTPSGETWTSDKPKPQFGEGVYIGSAVSNWKDYSGGKPDASNNNCVAYNQIGPNVRAEGTDIKEGTNGGLIIGNAYDLTGISGENSADSAIDAKGNNYLVYGNRVINPNKNPIVANGFEAHEAVKGDGTGNVFQANNIDLQQTPPAPRNTGYGFWQEVQIVGNVFCSDNVVLNAPSGPARIPVTQCVPRSMPSCAAVLEN